MSKRYCFVVKQEVVTPVDVHAETEREARERVLHRDGRVTVYDPEYGEMRLLLLRCLDE